jgi:hypothetical protein
VDADPLQRARLLRKAHEVVLSGGARPKILRDLVVDSWARSVRAGVDPAVPAPRLVSEEGAAGRLASHPLGRLLPVLRSLLAGVADAARHIMVLSDADGLLLWAEGHPRMLAAAAGPNFIPGALCSEAAVGTNAVGTTLVLGHPLQIFSAEHFSSLLHGWTCSAAPIHDPATGALLGAIDVSGSFRTAHPHSLSLVTAVARVAESHLALEAARRDEQLRTRYLSLVMRSAQQPSALVAKDGRVLISRPPAWLTDPVPVPAGGGRFTLPDGREAVAEPLESGQAHLLWRVDRAAPAPPRATLRLQALGRRRAILRQDGGSVELTPRHSEILALLALSPDGLTGEELAAQIYGTAARSATIRAEMSRLRRLLACRLVGNPYRLAAEVEADFLEIERRLDAGDAAGAARQHRGPLLPRSQVPLIVCERERIERRLQEAGTLRLIQRGSPALAARTA